MPKISFSFSDQIFHRLYLAHHKFFLLFLAFGLSFTPVVVAQPSIDSLKSVLKSTRGEQRAKLLLELSYETRQKNMESAIEQAEEALDISKRLGNEELQSNSILRLAWFYSIVNRDTTALKYYLSALKMERQHGHRPVEATILYDLGRFYLRQANQPRALNYFFQALRIYRDIGSSEQVSETMVSIGDVYFKREKFKEAIAFYKDAYVLSKEINSYNEMSFAASGAAYAFKKQENYKQAITYFEKGLEAARNIKSIHRIHAQASILLGMSSVYQDQQLYRKAIALINKQLQLANVNESRMLRGLGYKNLAELYQDQGDLERSNEYLKKVVTLRTSLGTSFTDILNELAQNYIQQQKFSAAVNTAQRGLRLAKKSGSIQQEKALLETLIEAYNKQGSYQKAFRTQNELIAVNNTIYNREKARQIAEMQTRYETGRKEQEIALLQKEQEKAELLRNLLIIGLALILIIGYLIYNRQRLKIKKNKTEMENTQLKRQQLEQDIEYKNKQLTTHSLHLVQKNESMKELKKSIKGIQNGKDGVADKKLRSLQQLVDYSFNLDKDWDDFKHYFEEVHTGFFDILKDKYPDLTTGELRLSALVKLNLTIKEISTILGISPDSVKTARYRLRKKLGMKTEENLTDFMMNVERKSTAG